MTETIYCHCCEEEVPIEESREVDGELICNDCYVNETTTCSRCDERIFNSDNAGTPDIVLCQSCFENHYTHCDDCGALLGYDSAYQSDYDDRNYCYDCHIRKADERPIQDYYYKPDPIFYGEGNRYFGIELEIDCGGELSNYAQELKDIANCSGDHIYCKHDGSLDDGFEMVTHPMSCDYHLNHMPWKAVMKRAAALGYTSHMARTCGLHIHVSRGAFGDTHDQQEDVIARILYFFEAHWEELLKFSRRTESQLTQWAARYGRKDNPKDVLDTAKKSGARYTCVNLTNRSTIEFRMFRGTLKYNTLIATLQLVNRLCDVAISLSDNEIKELSWTSFVADITEPELIQYLKERRLYVNEPVYTEEEL